MNKVVDPRGLGIARMIVNRARNLAELFPGYGLSGATQKHNHYLDFGYPDQVTFEDLYAMYRRNGFAKGIVKKFKSHTWRDNPLIQEDPDQDEETPVERTTRLILENRRIWQAMAVADARSMVGTYGAVVLRIADGKAMDQPVNGRLSIDALIQAIPVWQSQLTVKEYYLSLSDENYGQPKMFEFKEMSPEGHLNRSIPVHPDRVIIFSDDGTVTGGESELEAGYNDLLTIEKIIGSGGEGFWKNAKSSPILNVDKDQSLQALATLLGAQDASGIADKMNEIVDDFQKGFDSTMMLQGITADSLSVNLPSPEHFFSIAVQSLAASLEMPVKVLVGMQTGERASTEDAKEFLGTVMSRRNLRVRPTVQTFVERLQDFGMIPNEDWEISWPDLTESSAEDSLRLAKTMVDINTANGDPVFEGLEIRRMANFPGEMPGFEDEEEEDDA